MKKMTLFAGIIFVVLFLLGINCYAGGNVIYGCYQKHGGELRIVVNNTSCRHNEIPISWNRIGPSGPAGPPGPQGPEGPMGPAGPAGVRPQAQDPRVYDAKGQLLGIFPADWDGILSFFVPTISRFLHLSPVSGDVDPSYPPVSLYYDDSGGVGCSGKSYLDVNVRYQIVKLDSKYLIADNSLAVCTNDVNIKSVSMLQWNELGSLDRVCRPVDPSTCTLVVPSNEVTLPFKMPVALPVHFE